MIECLKFNEYSQVVEMTVLQPSEPQYLLFNGAISFSSPKFNGGSRILEYEASICKLYEPVFPSNHTVHNCTNYFSL